MPKSCIFIVAGGRYTSWLPIFTYCAKKAYPHVAIVAHAQGRFHGWRESWKSPFQTCPDYVTPAPVGMSGIDLACYRFFADGKQEDFDYCLITDVDVMMQKEEPSFIQQRSQSMRINDLGCYDNFVATHYAGKPRMPGIHFVSADWWHKTRSSRAKHMKDLLAHGCHDKNMDEVLLGEIVTESGLPVIQKQCLWNTHGVHLGAWRDHSRHIQNAQESLFLNELIHDPAYMAIVEDMQKENPDIHTIFRNVRKALRG